MKLSRAKLLNKHEATVTKSIKKRPTVMIQHSNSQIITLLNYLICKNKFLLCYCDACMNESVQNCINMVLNKGSLEQSKKIID